MNSILKTQKPIIIQKYSTRHKAVDIVGEGYVLDTVTAHSDGKVIWIQTGKRNDRRAKGDAAYGNAVKIKHENGYCTLYAHLNKVYVNKNQKVKKGDSLGYIGNSGKTYGSYLHFEVRTNENFSSRIDPTIYLTKSF